MGIHISIDKKQTPKQHTQRERERERERESHFFAIPAQPKHVIAWGDILGNHNVVDDLCTDKVSRALALNIARLQGRTRDWVPGRVCRGVKLITRRGLELLALG